MSELLKRCIMPTDPERQGVGNIILAPTAKAAARVMVAYAPSYRYATESEVAKVCLLDASVTDFRLLGADI